jgi:hypothetical protein
MTCHSLLIKRLSDTLSILVLLSSPIEKDDQDAISKRIKVASLTTSGDLTTTNKLKKHLLYKDEPPPSNVYTPFLSTNQTSFP